MVLRGLAFVALLLFLTMAAEIPFAPWSISFGLWPTLTGRWLGTATGAPASVLFLDLSGGMGRGPGPNRAYIDGRALWCDGTGAIREYRVSGEPGNWRGTIFGISTTETSPLRPGPSLSRLRGRWDRDVIEAESLVIQSAGDAPTVAEVSESAPSGRAPDVWRYVLHHGSETDFLAACERMAHGDGARE